MINYLTGIITEINDFYVTLELNNIGYIIKVPNPKQFIIEEKVKLYIHQIVKETTDEFYGFQDSSKRKFFELLLTVKGLGPKSALSILSSSLEEVNSAILNNDITFFKKYTGIGLKLSQQIILKFKDQINKLL